MPRGASFGVFPYLHEFLLREPYIEKWRGAPAERARGGRSLLNLASPV